jgi:hypothetical protein
VLNNQIAIGVDSFVTYPGAEDREIEDSFVCTQEVNGSGVIHPGYAVDQIRLCTEFSGEKRILLKQILALQEAAEAVDCGIVRFLPKRLEGSTRVLRPSVWNSPVYKAVTKQLFAPEEGGILASEIEGLADTGSSVIDFDVTHLSNEERLLRWNLLNALAPIAMASAHDKFCLGKPGRHKSWRYCAQKERLPLGWRWQPDWQTYQAEVELLTATFAEKEERASYRDVLGSGLFHWAQLLSVKEREILRFWALPTMAPLQILICLEAVDAWLEDAVLVMHGLKPKTLSEAVSFLPSYEDRRIPYEQSVRLRLWESQ